MKQMEVFSELTYLRDRSTQEFQMAQRASDPKAAKPHYRIAIAYHERAQELGRWLSNATTRTVEPSGAYGRDEHT